MSARVSAGFHTQLNATQMSFKSVGGVVLVANVVVRVLAAVHPRMRFILHSAARRDDAEDASARCRYQKLFFGDATIQENVFVKGRRKIR